MPNAKRLARYLAASMWIEGVPIRNIDIFGVVQLPLIFAGSLAVRPAVATASTPRSTPRGNARKRPWKRTVGPLARP